MSDTLLSSDVTNRLLEEACARNIPIEIHYQRTDGSTIRCRSRLLALADTHIIADQPTSDQQDRRIPGNHPISVLMRVDGTRYKFDSVIEDHRIKFQLNEHRKVMGIALRMPEALRESQRRADFRVPLAGGNPILVTVAPCHPTVPDACAVDAVVARGWMADISGGGSAVLLDHQFVGSVRDDGRFFLTFALCDAEDEFHMMGIVRHVRRIPEREDLRVGFEFCSWGLSRLREDQGRIMRFVAGLQRRERQRVAERDAMR